MQSVHEYAPAPSQVNMMHEVNILSDERHPPLRVGPFARIKRLFVVLSCLAPSQAYNHPGIGIHLQRHRVYIPANCLIRKAEKYKVQNAKYYNSIESYDVDAIETKNIGEKSSQSIRNSIRVGAGKTRKRRKDTRSKKKNDCHGAKSSGGDASKQMPPWLARYEGGNLSPSYHLGDESQSISLMDPTIDDSTSNLHRLHLALKGIFHQRSTADTLNTAGSFPEAIPYFTDREISEVMDAIRVASQGSTNLMAGCADFLYLMLTLEEEDMLNNEILISESWDDDDIESEDDGWVNGAGQKRPRPLTINTRDILIAASFHYCDCVRARKAGVYGYARKAMEASLDTRIQNEPDEKRQLWLPSGVEAMVEREGGALRNGEREVVEATIADAQKIPAQIAARRNSAIDHYGEEAVRIAAGAARLKRAEIMATTVNSNGSLITRGVTNKPGDNAEILRSFLLSLSEDWRSLVIRSAACLYRLKGIDDEYTQNNMSKSGVNSSTVSVVLSKTNISVARDAFRVYAPLAQRLGMQRLKTELENTAFRLLYPRQFYMASSLYSRDIHEMKSIVQVLSSRIEKLLKSDSVLTGQTEDVAVTSRVKEPYSLWKKMIRFRKGVADTKKKAADDPCELSPPSLKWIPDVIAFRVVLRALRLSPLEDDESLRTREKMLCYYAMQLIRDVWPASSCNEAKDYIKHPKPNGYQSLHYTASLMIAGEEWPFEVQIRSEEMHRIAEFGVAAHWDYKLQKKETISLPEKPLSYGNTAMIAHRSDILPEEEEVDNAIVMKIPSRESQKGRIASYIDALTSSRETIVQNNLFFFISSTKSALDGKIVSIDPSASSVTDALKKYGAEMYGRLIDDISAVGPEMYRNGVTIISLDEELCNGDVLTLPPFIIDYLTF